MKREQIKNQQHTGPYLSNSRGFQTKAEPVSAESTNFLLSASKIVKHTCFETFQSSSSSLIDFVPLQIQ
jgi:hypothetical protein